MGRAILRTCWIGLLVAELMTSGCVSTATIKQPAYSPYLKGSPITDDALQQIKSKSPKDAVFAELLQAFALMRTGDLNKSATRKEILGLLATAVTSFEDMNDPVNFSMAFSADEDKAFRGRPHERMFASTMAGVFLMADNQCGQALPYLRNAEFLDARFQKMPFGTDAPLIYSLMYRCLIQQNASKADIARAADGVFRSVRFLTMQDPFIEALVKMAEVDMRPLAVSNRLAYMIYEISLYNSLMSAPDNFDAQALAEDAAKNTSLFVSALKSNFEEEYKARINPLVDELAKVYGMDSKAGKKNLEELSFEQVALDANTIAKRLKNVVAQHSSFKKQIHHATEKTRALTDQILAAARGDKMVVSFTGFGPTLVRKGSYDEISVIKPGPEASLDPAIRMREMRLSKACGFHRLNDGDFSVVLCKPGVSDGAKVEVMPSLELLSLSRKATTAQGRKFDAVLKGRAQFRAATEKIAEVSAWSAFILFYIGAEIMSSCARHGGDDQTCYARGLAVWAVAGITAVFSGTVWLIGRSKNPSADSRFIHLMYESSWVSI